MNVKLQHIIEEPYCESLIKARNLDPDIFLYPNVTNLQDPINLENIDLAAQKIEEYQNKKTLVIVDSDCDGYCSSAILINYLKNIFPDWTLDFAVHERKDHGLEDIIENMDISEYKLIILPDAGTNDDFYFNQFPNICFIVLDHHQRSSDFVNNQPNAIIVNNQLSDKYINKSLSGGGVTWQFTRYLDKKYNKTFSKKFIDLAAISIISDLMDITTPENQYIISEGLKNINNIFFKKLFEKVKNKELSPSTISFYVVPFVNAICRLGTQDEKIRLFLSLTNPFMLVKNNSRKAASSSITDIDIVTESIRECTNAKARQNRLQEKISMLCKKQIIENDLLKNKILTIVLDEFFDDIPSEMNGLIAIRIANDLGRPTLIGRVNSDGIMKGSIRGLNTIEKIPSFKNFLLSSNMFEYIEGHDNAAGFSIPYKKLTKLNNWANEQLKDIAIDLKTWFVDFEVDGEEYVSIKNIITDMNKLKNKWGQNFLEPLIFVKNIPIFDIKILGTKQDTIEIKYKDISYMFFKQKKETINLLLNNTDKKINIVGKTNLNVYNNLVKHQIFIEDYVLI